MSPSKAKFKRALRDSKFSFRRGRGGMVWQRAVELELGIFFPSDSAFTQRGRVPWKLHSFIKTIQFMRGTASQVNISGSTSLPLTDLQHLGALQPPFKIDLYFLFRPLNFFPLLLCLHLVQHRTKLSLYLFC